MIPVPLPESVVCRDLLPGKTNHEAEVIDVALQDPVVLPSGWPMLYISLMHSKLNLHLDGFPRPHALQMQLKRASTTAPIMSLIYHFQNYYVKIMLAHVQKARMMLPSQENQIKSSQMDVRQNDIIFYYLKRSQC